MEGNSPHCDNVRYDYHPDLRADDMLTNRRFNDCIWCGELPEDDGRWVYGILSYGLIRAWHAVRNNGEVRHG